jgi:hypothetical protein
MPVQRSVRIGTACRQFVDFAIPDTGSGASQPRVKTQVRTRRDLRALSTLHEEVSLQWRVLDQQRM